MIGRSFVVALLIALWVIPAAALAQASVSARFDRNTTQVGETLVLEVNVSVEGARLPDFTPQMPPGFEKYFKILGSGSSYQTVVRGGSSSVRRQVSYQLRALKPGKLELPPIQVQVGSQLFKSLPLRITIEEARALGQGGQPYSRTPYFAELRLDADEPVYPGEEIRATLVLFSVVPFNRWGYSDGTPQIPKVRMKRLEGSQSTQFLTVERGGVQYHSAAVDQFVFYPLLSGELEIPPISVQLQVTQRSNLKLPQGMDSLLDQFFQMQRGQVVETQTPLQRLEVKPLPQQGRPADFSGAVGRIELRARLGESRAEVGEAVPYTIEMLVRGDAAAALPPKLALPKGFDAFEPQVSEGSAQTPDGGLVTQKTISYLIVPRVPGATEFSPAGFSWFDTVGDRYRSWQAPPVQLSVTGTAEPGALQASPTASGGERGAKHELRYIKPDALSLETKGAAPWRSAAFAGALVAPVLAWGAAFGVARRRARASVDIAWARRQGAGRKFRGALKELRKESGAAQAWPVATAALLELIGDLWNFEARGLTHPDLVARLAAGGLERAQAERVGAFLDAADAARFAGGAVRYGDAAAVAAELEALGKALLEGCR